MSSPRFHSIELDNFSSADVLPGHYVGLMRRIPSLLLPHGIELQAKGYQRAYYEPKSITAQCEWGAALEEWGDIVGFIVYDRFEGGEALFWSGTPRPMRVGKGDVVIASYEHLHSATTHAFLGRTIYSRAQYPLDSG